MISGEFWIARNPGELRHRVESFATHLEQSGQFPVCWKAKPYTDPRSLDQNSIYWVWVTDFARYLLDKQKISEREKEDMAYTLQRRCYAATQWDWLMESATDLTTGESKPQRRSTKKFLKGEMTMYLEWIQIFAADRGLILESLGEYRELQDSQVA